MTGYWVVHMRDGRDLRFNERAGYITTLDNAENLVVFMTNKFGEPLAVIPSESILWVERVKRKSD